MPVLFKNIIGVCEICTILSKKNLADNKIAILFAKPFLYMEKFAQKKA